MAARLFAACRAPKEEFKCSPDALWIGAHKRQRSAQEAQQSGEQNAPPQKRQRRSFALAGQGDLVEKIEQAREDATTGDSQKQRRGSVSIVAYRKEQ